MIGSTFDIEWFVLAADHFDFGTGSYHHEILIGGRRGLWGAEIMMRFTDGCPQITQISTDYKRLAIQSNLRKSAKSVDLLAKPDIQTIGVKYAFRIGSRRQLGHALVQECGM